VAGDFGKADQFIVLIADCIDLHRRPEPAAVLADAPAFCLVMAVARRAFENARGQARHAFFSRVEFGKVLSDDFRRGISLQPFRTGIPVYDDTARIEHVDRAILHRLDQQAEPALALVQRLLGFALLGHVTGDLGKANGAAAGIAYWLDNGGGPEPAAVLADAPALLLGPAVASSERQHPPRHVGSFVFGSKEQRKMLAEDLGGAVTLDPLRASVPGADHAVAIQQIDRIVRDRIDQELESVRGRQLLYGAGKLEFHFIHIRP